MVKEVPNIIFRLLDLGLERIISEVLDNSLDKNADDIRVNFVIPNSEAKTFNPVACLNFSVCFTTVGVVFFS